MKHTKEETKAFVAGWVSKHKTISDENAALKEALAELIAAGYCNCIDLKLLDKASKLLDKQSQSESDGDKNLG